MKSIWSERYPSKATGVKLDTVNNSFFYLLPMPLFLTITSHCKLNHKNVLSYIKTATSSAAAPHAALPLASRVSLFVGCHGTRKPLHGFWAIIWCGDFWMWRPGPVLTRVSWLRFGKYLLYAPFHISFPTWSTAPLLSYVSLLHVYSSGQSCSRIVCKDCIGYRGSKGCLRTERISASFPVVCCLTHPTPSHFFIFRGATEESLHSAYSLITRSLINKMVTTFLLTTTYDV